MRLSMRHSDCIYPVRNTISVDIFSGAESGDGGEVGWFVGGFVRVELVVDGM